MEASSSVSVAIMGSGGAGALTTGSFLLEAASTAGWYGLFSRTLGPQIRGGEAAALLRLAVDPVEGAPELYDLIIGIDWLNAQRFGAEIQTGPHSLVISDSGGEEPPPNSAWTFSVRSPSTRESSKAAMPASRSSSKRPTRFRPSDSSNSRETSLGNWQCSRRRRRPSPTPTSPG